ncbi:branched-chain amino acid ABC transporter permease [Haloplasma contractile]|uniref:ABC transporter permease protein n=1 Tax=Haloplasma contractile SSD-17B TaxID=1033810 RepID=U2EAF7_9MOLU|nr:branched-chain amino acid ABC transporter permease [Haloplasma contractile]ERJ11816.1 ABC transporter permease protein [Haloplasma contractile SSD-17B]
MSDFLRLLFSSLETGSVYALAALGIVLIFRTSKMTNFAQGMIGTINAYIAATLLIDFGINIWFVALIAMVTAFLTGILIDTIIIRPASKVNPISKQIITFGIIMVIVGLLPYISVESLYIPRFIDSEYGINILGAPLRYNTIFIILLSVALMGGMFWFIGYTKWGLATRTTASNETTSKLMGVPTKTVTMVSWAFAAILGTLAAIFVAPRVSVQPNMLLTVQVSAFFAGTLGGFNTFFGPVIGAFIISFARNFTGFYISDIWGNVIVYTLILVFLYFKPYGIFGKKPTTKV